MKPDKTLRVVIDTNVLFEGLTKRGGAAGLIIDSWVAGLFQVCISDSLVYEYTDVLYRKLSENRLRVIQPVLGTLIGMSEFITIHYRWRPMSPDPHDDHVIDCVMNAGAILITANTRDFLMAKESLGIMVFTSVQFLELLAKR